MTWEILSQMQLQLSQQQLSLSKLSCIISAIALCLALYIWFKQVNIADKQILLTAHIFWIDKLWQSREKMRDLFGKAKSKEDVDSIMESIKNIDDDITKQLEFLSKKL